MRLENASQMCTCILPCYRNTLNSFKYTPGSPLSVTPSPHTQEVSLLGKNRNKCCHWDAYLESKVSSLCQKLDQSLRRKIMGRKKWRPSILQCWKLIKNISWECLKDSSERVTLPATFGGKSATHPSLTACLVWGHTGHVWETAQPPLLQTSSGQGHELLPKRRRSFWITLEEISLSPHP